MGRARRFIPVLVLFLFLQRAAAGQEPLHWEATIDSAKAAAAQSNRLVLVFFCASYCGPCHAMERDLRTQPGAVSALETNFVPVKIDVQYYPNLAKQYGVTRLPTTVIVAPNAAGEPLSVIPERIPVDQYLAKVAQVAADLKRRNTGVLVQVPVNPPVGAHAAISALPNGTVPVSSNENRASAPALPPVGAHAAISPTPLAGSVTPAIDLKERADSAKRSPSPLFGLDGFCPVQLVENSRWQPGKKAWGAVHRGRTYLFSGEEEQHRFLTHPDRYAPVSSGNDVVLLLEQGRSVTGCREHGLQFDGHVYLFTEESTLDKFRSNPRYYADRALQAMRPTAQTAAVR